MVILQYKIIQIILKGITFVYKCEESCLTIVQADGGSLGILRIICGRFAAAA